MTRRIVFAALIVFIGLASILTALLGTEPGTRLVIEQGARFSPGHVEIDTVRGTLLQGVSLEGIRFEDGNTRAGLERLEVRVNAAALFTGRLAVTRLNAHGLNLVIDPDPDPAPTEPFQLPERIVLPLSVELAPARFTRLRIQLGEADPVFIDEIRLAAEVDGEGARVRSLNVDAADFGFDVSGRATLAWPYALELDLKWRASLPAPIREGLRAEQADGVLVVNGDLRRLEFRHRVETPVQLTSSGEVRDLLETPGWDMEHRWETFTWHLPDGQTLVPEAGRLHSAGTTEEYELDLDAALAALDLPPQEIRLTGRGDQHGISRLNLGLNGRAGRLELSGEAAWLPDPTWDLRVQASDVDTALVHPELLGRLSLDARLQGRLEDTATLVTDLTLTSLSGALLDQAVQASGSARITETGLTTPALHLRLDDASLDLSGQIGWATGLEWSLNVTGEGLDPGQWLPDWPGQLTLDLAASGRLDSDNRVFGDLKLDALEGKLAGHHVGVRGEALLRGHGLDTSGLHVRVDDSQLRLSGEAHWLPEVRWDLHVEADNLDPGVIDRQLAGQLTLRGQSRGRLDPDIGVDALIDVEKLEGVLRDYPVFARGSARIEEGRRLVTPGLEAHLGENRLEVRGRAEAASADLNYRIDAPALDAVWPGLRGRLTGHGTLAGNWQQPDLDMQLDGENLGFDAWTVDRLSLEARGTLQPDSPLRMEARLDGVRLESEPLVEQATLTVGGHEADHTLDLEIRSREGNIILAMAGRITDPSGWQGQITRLDLDATRLGDWRLSDAAPLSITPQRLELRPLCVGREAARLCLEAQGDSQTLDAILDLSALPLSLLDTFLPDNTGLDGLLSADARLRLRDRLNLEARATVGEAEMHILDLDGERDTIPFRNVALEGRFRDGGLSALASMSFLGQGQAEARLDTHPEGDTHGLQGVARADLRELRWLESMAPQLRDVTGRLQIDLRLAGTLKDPDFSGELRLDEGAALVSEAGLNLEDIGIRASASGLDRLILEGQVSSGPGQLNLQGELGLTEDGQPWAQLGLTGERFQAVRRPEAEVYVSPDLAMALTGREIQLTGELAIPEARIELRELPPQAASVSRDEVIVDAEESAPPWLVDTRVTVSLGEQVTLSGFGLAARLAGAVDLEDSPARPTRVEGEIRIEDGSYRAYGQDLIVERGVLVFQGPADNPGLDIRAVRRVPAYEVTAGLAIGGTLQDPRTRVFSTPAMEDSEAMAYLLTGRPLSGASEADANVLTAAITAFGVEQGGMLTERIGQAVGLDEFVLDAEGDLDQSALMMGKNLSSRLYMRYTVGLFERASSLMLRYRLSRTLSLETQTSDEAQSVDLIYRLER